MSKLDGGALAGNALANEGIEKAFVLCGGRSMPALCSGRSMPALCSGRSMPALCGGRSMPALCSVCG